MTTDEFDGHTPEVLLELVKSEATAFDRCCDLWQDALGGMHCRECAQKTFSMLRNIQQILGVDKVCRQLTDEETTKAREFAILRSQAPTLLRERDEARAEVERLTKSLRTIEDVTHTTPDDCDHTAICDQVNEIAQAAIKGEQ